MYDTACVREDAWKLVGVNTERVGAYIIHVHPEKLAVCLPQFDQRSSAELEGVYNGIDEIFEGEGRYGRDNCAVAVLDRNEFGHGRDRVSDIGVAWEGTRYVLVWGSQLQRVMENLNAISKVYRVKSVSDWRFCVPVEIRGAPGLDVPHEWLRKSRRFLKSEKFVTKFRNFCKA
jgi:hypothetical protein